MFENSGEKIKSVAKEVFAVIVIIICVMLIGAFIIASNMPYGGGALVVVPSILIAAIVFIVAWVKSLFMVAFGDLVDSNERIVKLLEYKIFEIGDKKEFLEKNNSIYELISNSDSKSKETYVEYVVVFSDGSEQKVLVKKNSKWNDIVAVINDNDIDLPVHYIIDEDGRKVFKGGYLG